VKQEFRLRLFVDAHVFDGLPQGSRTFIKEIYLCIAGMPGIQLYLGAHDIHQLATLFPPTENLVLVQYRTASRLRRLLFEIPAIIRRHHIDYAHFQYITPLWKNCRHIVTIHDVLFKDFPAEFSLAYRLEKRLFYGLAAWRSDIITTVSAFSAGSIKKFLFTGSKPIHVIPNGVSKRFFEPYDPARSREYIREKYGRQDFILYVSRIEPRKNHTLVLKAWLDLQLYQQGIDLVFLGHITIPVPELDEALAKLPPLIRNRVMLDSSADDHDLLEMYRAARVFVYPSRAEGFGIPPLEAAALQIPVICSNTSAMKDFSFFGSNHIDPLDEETFKRRLQQVLSDPPGADVLGEIATIIRRDYSWEGSARKLYSLLVPEQKNPNFEKS
jgi:glycosyltransferase involved in cell wall biosynthesis